MYIVFMYMYMYVQVDSTQLIVLCCIALRFLWFENFMYIYMYTPFHYMRASVINVQVMYMYVGSGHWAHKAIYTMYCTYTYMYMFTCRLMPWIIKASDLHTHENHVHSTLAKQEF